MGPRAGAVGKQQLGGRSTAPSGVGGRVRQLRLERTLTQAELGGTRFTKEYVSQVELGKTRPSAAAIAWFAERLGVDRVAIAGESGVFARAACEAGLARAEAELGAHRDDQALAILAEHVTEIARGDARMRMRHSQARGWALHNLGLMDEALLALAEARSCAEELTASDRAGVLYRIGMVRYQMGSLATAVALLDEALRLAEEGGGTSD